MLQTKISNFYTTYTLFNVARALVSIIGPVYLWRLGFSIQEILFYFICTAVFKVFCLPLTFKAISRFGTKPSMITGVIMMLVHYGLYATIGTNPLSLVLLAATLGIGNACFFPAFRVAFSHASTKNSVGKQSATLNSLTLVFGAVSPVIGGVLATFYGVTFAYALPVLVLLCSLYPVIRSNNIPRQPFALSRVPRGKALKNYAANASYSFSGLADMLVWPLLISMIIPTYAGLGAYAGALVLIAAAIQMTIGKLSDKKNSDGYLLAGTSLDTIYNLARVWVSSVPHMIGLGFLSSLSSSLIAGSYGGRFYKNIDESRRLEYMFGLEMANSVTWLVYFPVLLIVSYVTPLATTLQIGILLIAGASLGMNRAPYRLIQNLYDKVALRHKLAVSREAA